MQSSCGRAGLVGDGHSGRRGTSSMHSRRGHGTLSPPSWVLQISSGSLACSWDRQQHSPTMQAEWESNAREYLTRF